MPKRTNWRSRFIQNNCVIPNRQRRNEAEKKGNYSEALIYDKLLNYCVIAREKAKGVSFV